MYSYVVDDNFRYDAGSVKRSRNNGSNVTDVPGEK